MIAGMGLNLQASCWVLNTPGFQDGVSPADFQEKDKGTTLKAFLSRRHFADRSLL